MEINLKDYPFVPHRLVPGGILQTIVGAGFCPDIELPDRVTHWLKKGPNSTLVLLEIEAKDEHRPLVLLSHGMGGCSESGYMRRIARKLYDEGFGVFMMNQRGSGPGIGLSDRLWNGGASEDLDHIIRFICDKYPEKSLLVAGFSLSGNILLKYLGEGKRVPYNVFACFAVNPPINLKKSSLLLSQSKKTALFNKDFMKLIDRQMEAMIQCYPDTFFPPENSKTIYDFDAAYTAPAGEYRDVDDYYEQCSSKQFLGNISVPTTILCSRDDPFVPPEDFEDAKMSFCVKYLAPENGGHMGYISKNPTPFGDKRWMDYLIVDWAKNIFSLSASTEEASGAAIW